MSPRKRRQSESSDSSGTHSPKHPCSSLRVNLSYTSDHSISDDDYQKTNNPKELGAATTKVNKRVNSPRILRVEDVNLDLREFEGRTGNAAGTSCKTPPSSTNCEEELSRSCSELKGIILSKTLALFGKENSFSIKTSQVFDDQSRVNASPSVKVCLGNDEEISMSGKDSSPVKVLSKNFTLTTPPGSSLKTTKEKQQTSFDTPKCLSPRNDSRRSSLSKKRLFGDEKCRSSQRQSFTQSGSPILSGQVRRSRLNRTLNKCNRGTVRNSLLGLPKSGEESSSKSIYRLEPMDLTEVQGAMLFKKNSQEDRGGRVIVTNRDSSSSNAVGTSLHVNTSKSSGNSKNSLKSPANTSSSLKVNTSLDQLDDSKKLETRDSSVSINLENSLHGLIDPSEFQETSGSKSRSSLPSFIATTPYPLSRSQLYKTHLRTTNTKYNLSQSNLDEESFVQDQEAIQ